MSTIRDDTSPLVAIRHSLMGGMFRIQLLTDGGPGHRHGRVLDDDGNVIGDARDLIYAGYGFSVHTRPYAGFVPDEQIEFVR